MAKSARKPSGQKKRSSVQDKPFRSCREEIVSLLAKNRLDLNRSVITSRDKFSQSVRRKLKIKKVPDGFVKWRLPFFLQCEGVNFYISSANPHTKVNTHSHDLGPTIRFILEGSIIFRKKEYTTGDWIYLPPGKEYSFQSGSLGASFILGYCCCC